MGGTSDRLRQRAHRRADWISGAAKRFEADASVGAAWLFGSEGRGDADELSDVDLVVVLAAGVDPSYLATLESTFAQFGAVVGVEELELPAPVETIRSFAVDFAAPVEPLRVDWYCTLPGDITFGNDVRVLVDRLGLSPANPPAETLALLPGGIGGTTAPRRAARRVERLQERVTWFWSTAPTVAKWLARGWTEQAAAELDRMFQVVDEAVAYLGRPPFERVEEQPPARPLSNLRTALVELSALSSSLRVSGLKVPPPDRPFGWLELAEDLEAEGWSPAIPRTTGSEGVP
jgi:predicted nucleotidyltransferase